MSLYLIVQVMLPMINVLMFANMDITVLREFYAIFKILMNKFTIMGSKKLQFVILFEYIV